MGTGVGSITSADLCERLDYALFSHSIAFGQGRLEYHTPTTTVTACKSYLNWRCQVYPLAGPAHYSQLRGVAVSSLARTRRRMCNTPFPPLSQPLRSSLVDLSRFYAVSAVAVFMRTEIDGDLTRISTTGNAGLARVIGSSSDRVIFPETRQGWVW